MENKNKSYDYIKTTEIKWIGEIPSHWRLLRLKEILIERKEKNSPLKTDFILSLTAKKGVIPYSEKGSGGNKAKDDLTKYYLAHPDDLVINCMNVVAGSVGVSKYFGAISPVYYALHSRNDSINIYYCNYIFQLKSFQRSLIGLGNGILMKETSNGNLNTIRMRIPMSKLNNVLLPIPTKDEQYKIVQFLDSKIARINKFIINKKRIMDDLKELKQVTINQKITKGLNKSVSFKKINTEKIPTHWDVKRLSRIAKIILSGLDKKIYKNQSQVKLCNYVDVYKNDYITNDIDFMIATASDIEISNYTLKRGDLIITKDSESWDDIAVPSYVIDELENVLCGYHLAIIRTILKNVNSEFIYYSFLSNFVSRQFKVKAKGVTRYAIGFQHIHDVNIILPPKEEQDKIVLYLREKLKSIDAAINRIKNEIELINEYKVSLISDVVTGKIDTRNSYINDEDLSENDCELLDMEEDLFELDEVYDDGEEE